jgi:hypothetical protein
MPSVILAGIMIAALSAGCASGRSDGAQGEVTPTSASGDAATGFGDLPTPCGPASGSNQATGDQGVTADSVTIGYGDDAGYQAQPGFDHEMSDAISRGESRVAKWWASTTTQRSSRPRT